MSEPFWNGQAGLWRHGYTYSGHAAAAAAAMANLDILEREDLVDRVSQLESQVTATIGELASHSLVAEVRSGVGLLAAVQIDADAIAADPSTPARVVSELRSRGVLTRGLVDGSLQVSPPFVVTPDQLKGAAAACWEALDAAGGA